VRSYSFSSQALLKTLREHHLRVSYHRPWKKFTPYLH
jgi:hypothetical protein